MVIGLIKYCFSDENKYIVGMNDVPWQENICKIEKGEAGFPHKFLLIKNPPKFIYYLGDISLLNKPILGIVGPRNPSEYGPQILHRLFESVPQYDLVTVSGMAEGIDHLCHSLSVKHQIPTIAVLGGGLQHYLSRPERNIINHIVASGGLVISDFELGYKPTPWSFPQRNRIIAGLADVLFVPEATQKSGSLITVDFALEMGKPVFATANSIFSPSSEGINLLLEQKKINAVYDMKRFLSRHFSRKATAGNASVSPIFSRQLSSQEQKVITVVSQKAEASLQDIIRESEMPVHTVIQLLTLLEMDKCLRETSPGIYRIFK